MNLGGNLTEEPSLEAGSLKRSLREKRDLVHPSEGRKEERCLSGGGVGGVGVGVVVVVEESRDWS